MVSAAAARCGSGGGPRIAGPGESFVLRVHLAGLFPDDSLQVELPPDFLEDTVAGLLDRVFPPDEDRRREIADRFDLQDNPDLLDIYAVFLAVCEEWRDWRCELEVSQERSPVELDTPVPGLLAGGEDRPALSLRLEQHYRPLEYAVRHGFWEDRLELLDWLRSLALLYFIDKHEVSLELHPARPYGPALGRALDTLRRQNLVAASPTSDGECPGDDGPEGQGLAVTPEGRSFIARLLNETESSIDQYDHYQDTLADPERDVVEFGTGRGIDLRVQMFLAEGLDPVRTVFLLRLYDGTLDARLSGWQAAMESEEWFEGILEPVVNRYGISPAEAEWVLEHGEAWLEQLREEQRRAESDRRLLRRAGGNAP